MTDLACQMNSVVVVALYDTLGVDSMQYICGQTKLATISCSGNQVDKVISIKKAGKIDSVTNIISYDDVKHESIVNAHQVGIKLQTFKEVIDKGVEAKRTGKHTL